MKRLVIAMVLAGLLLLMMPMAVSADSGVMVINRTEDDGKWIGDTWTVEMYPGESKSTMLTLYNSSSSSLDVEVTVSPTSWDNGNLTFKLSETNFTMPRKSSKDITLTVKAGGSTTPNAISETYTTKLTIKSEVPPAPSPAPSIGIPMFALYNLTIKNIAESSADILWETSRPTTSKLVYWSSSETTIENETRITEHIVHLEELEDDTTYYFEITCRDKYRLKKSVTGEFTTLEKVIEPEPIVPEPEPVLPEPVEPVAPEPEEPEEPTEPIEPEEPEEPIEPEEPAEEPSKWGWLDSILAGLVLVMLGLDIWQWRKQRA